MNMNKNSFIQKMLIVLIIVTIMLNFIFPVESRADDVDWVGPLFSPIQALVCGLGDAVFNFLQPTFIDGAPKAVFKTTLDELQNGEYFGSGLDDFAYSIPILGNGIAWLDAWGANYSGDTTADLDGDGEVDTDEIKTYYSKDIVFPSIYYSVENIFANKIPAFDVNFINPSVNNPDVIQNGENAEKQLDIANFLNDNNEETDANFDYIKSVFLAKMQEINNNSEYDLILSDGQDPNKKQYGNGENTGGSLTDQERWVRNIDAQIQEQSSKIEWLDYYNNALDCGINLNINTNFGKTNSTKAIGNVAMQMQGTISKWYNTLRDLALVVMLTILVYIAIRIILSSTTEQAKYKTMLKDWLMAICMLFIMHYIMAFALYLTESLTDMLYGSYVSALNGTQSSVNAEAQENNDQENESEVVEQAKEEQGSITAQTLATSIRLAISFPEDTLQEMAYTILYTLFVIYTIMFTWQYFKRVVYMAFLTLIGPLVAITYPIDKVGDGQAQGFNMWLKEYIFNLLLQPLHLLLFTILAVSAMDLFKTNVLYSLIILGFLSQSIKIIRKFFGFDKAPIGSSYTSGFAGGAVFSTLLSGLQRLPHPKGGGGNNSNSGGSNSNNSNINFADSGRRGKDLKNLQGFNDGLTGSGSGGSGSGGSARQRVRRLPRRRSIGRSIGRVRNNTRSFVAPVANGARRIANTRGVRTITGIARGGVNLGKKYIPKGAKTATKLALAGLGAGTLGTIGVAAGLAGDEYSDVAKYGLTGIAGGYAVGKGVYGAAEGLLTGAKNGVGNVKDAFQEGYYGDKYEDVKADKEWNKSKEVEKNLKKEFEGNWKQVKKMQMELRKLGITDQKELNTASKLMLKNPNLTSRNAASLMKFKENVSMDDLRDTNKRIDLSNEVDSMVGGDAAKRDRIMDLLDQAFGRK